MRQPIRFGGKLKQVTISKRAGKYFASFLVETDEYDPKDVDRQPSVSNCGEVKKILTLKDRIFECDACGFVIDRDLNAAINLNNYAA